MSMKNCNDAIGCYNFQLNRSANSKWQFLSCATVAFSERYGAPQMIRPYVLVLLPFQRCNSTSRYPKESAFEGSGLRTLVLLVGWRWVWIIYGIILTAKRSARIKTCSSVALSATNITRTDPRSNPDLRHDRPISSRPLNGTTLKGKN